MAYKIPDNIEQDIQYLDYGTKVALGEILNALQIVSEQLDKLIYKSK